jgi:hypothetical protein
MYEALSFSPQFSRLTNSGEQMCANHYKELRNREGAPGHGWGQQDKETNAEGV